MTEPKWWERYDLVMDFARQLADEMDGTELLAYFEAPWKWEKQWKLRDAHDAEECSGITSCAASECEECYTDLPECRLELKECVLSDYHLCEDCRGLPQYALAPEWSGEGTGTP